MTEETITPPWLWKKGQSGNPAGRPKGIVDRRTAVHQAFQDDAENIAKKVVEAALKGDLQAANIVLSRLSPALKARAEKVTFKLDASLPLTEQAGAVLAAVSRGEVDPETGRLLIESIRAFADLKLVDEHEARIAAIENRQAEGQQRIRGGILHVETTMNANGQPALCEPTR